ncbi:hypothetical protein [Brachybacterium sp.]|uniref:hypothetical protein n=1 Tax=Brachybacterium sp. TaxID=1891286 RepID=UPI002ED28DA3
MTSTIIPSSSGQAGVPGLVGAAVPTESTPGGESTPRRRRSRFPDPGSALPASASATRPAVRWTGSDTSLRELVRDHATAVGLDLVESSADTAVVCMATDTAALLADARTPVRPRTPLLVVTDEPEVTPAAWARALEAGARAVLRLPSGSEELLSRFAELARPRSASLLLGVVGGCGGAGASSFAARLAAAARPLGAVTLIDADPSGGGVDLLVEAPSLEGISWQETADLGPDDGEALRAGLPAVDEVRLLVSGQGPGPRVQALPPVLSALAPLGGTVVVDLAESWVPAAAEHLDLLLVVVPATDHAVRAAARRLRSWQVSGGRARLVVRRSGPLSPREVVEDLALPLAAAFRDSPRGSVPLLDVRRRGADRAARELLAGLEAGGISAPRDSVGPGSAGPRSVGTRPSGPHSAGASA